MDYWRHVFDALKAEIALGLGAVWIWVGPLLAPDALAEYQHFLNFLTTVVIFALALYRGWRVIFRGDPPQNTFTGSR